MARIKNKYPVKIKYIKLPSLPRETSLTRHSSRTLLKKNHEFIKKLINLKILTRGPTGPGTPFSPGMPDGPAEPGAPG